MATHNHHTEIMQLILRRFSGEASEKDEKTIEEWLASDPKNQNFYLETETLWEKTGKIKGYSPAEIDLEWERLDKAIREIERSPSVQYFKIAAAILLLLCASFVYYQFFFDPPIHVIAQQVTETQLTDGSSVTLNRGSSITYSKNYGQLNRTVSLKGEGFFDVTRDPSLPFKVKTDGSEITVLGTSFNVRNIKDQVEVVVVTGIVNVSYGEIGVTLKQNEKAVVNLKNGEISKKEVFDTNELAWKTRKLIFTDHRLVDVVAIINRTYHSNLTIKNEELEHCTITVTFEDQPLDAILEVIKATLNLTTRKTTKGIEISGDGC